MRKLVVATHGKLAEGFRQTLGMLGADGFASLGFYLDDDCDEGTVERIFAELDEGDQLIACTDIGFGSVNQMFLKVAARHPEANALIVTGVNLPLLLELAVRPGELTRAELDEVVAQACRQMGVVDIPMPAGAVASGDEDDGDFFA